MSNILWSTDGHLQAETYWLANVQGREALEKVIVELVQDEDLTCELAEEAAKDISFRNSNLLYGLQLQLQLPESLGSGSSVSAGAVNVGVSSPS